MFVIVRDTALNLLYIFSKGRDTPFFGYERILYRQEIGISIFKCAKRAIKVSVENDYYEIS